MSDNEDVPRSRLRRLFSRLKSSTDSEKATEEALSELENGGLIDHDESEMMQSILFLDKTTVRNVMVPRTEITHVDKSATIDEMIKCIIESGHSRVLVTNASLDNVVGFIHVKDLLLFWGKNQDFQLDRILRKLYAVPESKKLNELLTEFQDRHEQFALVIDEFGGTSGLVSVEDILEEIVGEIEDEYDREEAKVIEQSENSLVVPGRFEMEKVCELLDTDEPEGTFNTVGGWIFERIGRVPMAGEKFEFDGFEVVVEAATERHIRRVHINKQLEPKGEE